MKRRPTPREKKALAYSKDSVPVAEFPQTFPTMWRRKKANAQRAYRRRVHQLLGRAAPVPTAHDDPWFAHVATVRRRRARKWGVVFLREQVTAKHQLRIERTGRNYFKQPYNTAQHRRRFSAFLASLVEGSTPYTHEVALYFATLLPVPKGARDPWPPLGMLPRNRVWLRAFLQDEPEWETRLREWIARLTSDAHDP